ncbi:anti-sigma factor domain-containing protein [Paenibacillus beijingensis]|uniref:RsgI N-terminal anti-sigma domain-containing protein n=1 Tax=Paenibacillus beijingensis TaxID=1126833 RepID=A0A0D5NEX7_9BACL|nr:anti-sigma factor domain-containing protein [Paenibacillus beijingensis]AJY73685.1 hypothetical protein VN24_02365 [Paenibacillus beijingensis]
MNRGVVVEINKRKVIVLTPDGQFKQVPSKGGERIGEEISLSSAMPTTRTIRFKIVAAAAALLLFIVPLLGKQTIMAHPVVAYLTVDVNPSFEIGIDKHDAVRKLLPLNDEAKVILNGVPYRGKPVNTVLEAITVKLNQAHYLDGPDRDVLITSIVLDTSKMTDSDVAELQSAAKEAVKKAMGPDMTDSIEITTLAATEKVREAGERNGVSAGKMTVYLLAKNKGYSIDLQDMKQKSIPELTEQWGGLKNILSGQEETGRDKLNQWLDSELSKQKEAASSSVQSSGTDKDKDEDKDKDKVKDKAPALPAAPKPDGDSVRQDGSVDRSASKPSSNRNDNAQRQSEQRGNDKDRDDRDKSSKQTSGEKDDRESRPDDSSAKKDDHESRLDESSAKKDDRESRSDGSSAKKDDRESRLDESSAKKDDHESRPDESSAKKDDRESRPDESSAKKDDRESRPDDSSAKSDDRGSRPDESSAKSDDRGSRPDESSAKSDDRGSRPDESSDKKDDRESRSDGSSDIQVGIGIEVKLTEDLLGRVEGTSN